MNILFLYDDESIVCQTQRVIGEHNLILCKYCNLEKLTDKLVDIVIMDFNLKRISERNYMPILSVKCRWNSPVLALLEDKSSENHLAILSMGVFEYLERPVMDEDYKKKIEEMIRWRWFLKNKISPNNPE
jgi:DNA-binding response OmpR family regulator